LISEIKKYKHVKNKRCSGVTGLANVFLAGANDVCGVKFSRFFDQKIARAVEVKRRRVSRVWVRADANNDCPKVER
jgi:hypothetical protein